MGIRYVVDEEGGRREVILSVEEYERLRVAGEEKRRMDLHPRVSFRGEENSRRAWVPGTPFDVWELVETYRGKGRERLLAEHPVSEDRLDVALAYYREYPEDIDHAIEENSRPPEYWMELYPELDMKIGP